MKIIKLLKIAAVSAALLGATSASAGISTTKHNLTASGGQTLNADTEEQLCVFCHTPHAASATFTEAPLWNKVVPLPGTFTMYGQTVAGNNPDAAGPNDPSLACLSCHDGVSAINSVVNAPGSGMGTGFVDFEGEAGTYVMPAGATNIGQALDNDHPISIDYDDTAASLKIITTPLVGWSGGTDIDSVLRNGKVECVTCHDPHLSTNGTFLRAANTGSALCLSCHDK